MKQNPCRYCVTSTVIKGKHYPSYKEPCRDCENLKKHREYLESNRKFRRGEQIKDIEELLETEWLIFHETTRNVEVFKSMQLRTVLSFIQSGYLFKAVRKEGD